MNYREETYKRIWIGAQQREIKVILKQWTECLSTSN